MVLCSGMVEKVGSSVGGFGSHMGERSAKYARRWGEKRVCKSKSQKLEAVGLFQDEINKKLHSYVARSTCASQNCKNTARSCHFCKSRPADCARHCGEKRICKSNSKNSHADFVEIQTMKKSTTF